jgi:hypothetical protein
MRLGGVASFSWVVLLPLILDGSLAKWKLSLEHVQPTDKMKLDLVLELISVQYLLSKALPP